MSTIGPQFEQMALPNIGKGHATPDQKYSNDLRASYNLNKDTPAVDQADKGVDSVWLATPRAHGIKLEPHRLSAFVGGSATTIAPGARQNYSHGGKGQTVMGLPSQGLAHTSVLDKHGNVSDENSFNGNDYADYGPQQSSMHQDLWDKHGETKMLPSTAILHTQQTGFDTGDHSFITGPLKNTEPAAHVLIHNGVPEMLDGHHRAAEWRGRGRDAFPARVLNLDQLGEHVQAQFDHANNPDVNDEIR